MTTDEHVDKAARAVQAEMLRQNHMLEVSDENGSIGIFDDYDNKFYDCRELARAALEAATKVE